MLETDYCPYCRAKIEIDEVVKLCDINGDEQDKLAECPNCGKFIRANFETRIHMSLTSEEDYLEQLEFEKENYREMIKTEYGQKSIDYYRFMIDEVNRKIQGAELRIEHNKEIENED